MLRRGGLAALAFAAVVVAAAHAQHVEDSVDVGGAWVGSLVHNPVGNFIHGRSWSAGSVFTIDCSTGRLVALVQVPEPKFLAFDSLDNKYYCPFGPAGAESVLVGCGTSGRQLRAVALRGAKYALWDRTTDRLYVSCDMEWCVGVIDCRADTVLGIIRVGDGPLRMDLDARRRRLYVQLYDEEAVAVVDLRRDAVEAVIRVGGPPLCGMLDPNGERYFVGTTRGLAVIDVLAGMTVRRVALPADIVALEMDKTGGRLFAGGITVGAVDTVWAIDSETEMVDRAWPVGKEPWDIYFSRQTEQLYCLSYRPAQMTVLADSGVRAVLGLADAPYCIAGSGAAGRLYVGHLNSRKVYVVRDSAPPAGRFGSGERDTVTVAVWPNPFRRQVTCRLGCSGPAMLRDEAGRMIQTFSCGQSGTVNWDGCDDSGRPVAAGVYFLVPSGGRPLRLVKLAD